jgi:hypothetical protein
MAGKNIHYTLIDSAQLKSFDAKDNNDYVRPKPETKSWVDDSLLGKTIFINKQVPIFGTNVSITDTLKPPIYFVVKEPQSINNVIQKYVPSIFAKHDLSIKFINPIFKNQPHNNWSFSIFLIGFSMLAMANFYYIKRFNLFAKAFFLQRFTGQLMREDNSQSQRLSIVLSCIYLFSISLLTYKFNEVNNFYKPLNGPITQFLLTCLAVLTFFVIKISLNYMLGYIFKTEKQVNEYVFNIILINQFLGLGLFFLCFCLYYSISLYTKFLLAFGVVLILGIYLYRIIRGILIGNNNKNISAIYLFLYFCTLEILPLVFIIKLMLG